MRLTATQLAELIDSQAGSLRLWVRARCASPEDAVQEAFCRLAMEDPPPDNSVAWLYRVARNVAENQRLSDQRRREREQSRAQMVTKEGGPTDCLELAETLAAVERLPDELREVLVARIWGQLSLEEVGRLCGIATATAFRRYQAALEALRVKLGETTRQK